MSGTGAFDEALGRLNELLAGSVRRNLGESLARKADGRAALDELVAGMRSHTWKAGAHRADLAAAIRALDTRTRSDGFHVLHDWDGVAGEVSPVPIAVEVAELVGERRGAGEADPVVLGILFDYYVLYLLGLLTLRIWDLPDPDAGLSRVSSALDVLQGPSGSRQPFARSAATLLLVATSHYEADEAAYVRLLDRVRSLGPDHQLAIAESHAASMGCHLRFGFEATYGRNIGAMREDNAADYPWLSYALATTVRAWDACAARGDDGSRLSDVLLNGLSPDPEAFLGASVPSVPVSQAERATIRDIVLSRRALAIEEWTRLRPTDDTYSPLSFFFNFCQNVLKGAVLDAALWGEPSAVALDDLLMTQAPGADDHARLAVSRTLMRYAQNNPHRIRGRLMPVIVFDPQTGRRAHATVLRALG